MKKKLLALAVAGAFVAPVAMADSGNVTIYGQVNASVVFADSDDAKVGTTKGTGSTHIASDQSRIGFKGTEDLGGGTSAIWQIESGINADAASSTLANRNTFVGLAGESWGDIKLGNMDSPYKSATRGLDVFGDTVADNRSILGQVGNAPVATTGNLDTRNTNSLTYTSPDLSGFKVSAQYVAAAEAATTSPTNKGSNYSMSLAYNAGPVTAAAAVVQLKGGSAGTGTAAVSGTGSVFPVSGATADDKIRGLRLGGGYKMDAITVNAVFERIEGDITVGAARVDTIKSNSFYLGGKFAVSGSDAVKVAYTRRGEVGEGANKVANSQVSQWALGYDHAMSKRTSVYALYTKLDNDNGSSLGLTNASTAQPVAAGAGAGPSAFALGVKHSF